MATSPPIKIQRDLNLDLLKTAVVTWATQETQRLENETQFLRSILSGRGVTNVGTKNLETASQLVVNQIDDFLRST